MRDELGLPEITRDCPSRDCIGSLPRPLPSAPLCAPLLPSAAPHAGGFTVYRRRTASPTAIGGTPRRPASPCSSHAARRAGWIGNRSQRIRVSAQVRGDTGDWRGLELGDRTGGWGGSEPGTNIASCPAPGSRATVTTACRPRRNPRTRARCSVSSPPCTLRLYAGGVGKSEGESATHMGGVGARCVAVTVESGAAVSPRICVSCFCHKRGGDVRGEVQSAGTSSGILALGAKS